MIISSKKLSMEMEIAHDFREERMCGRQHRIIPSTFSKREKEKCPRVQSTRNVTNARTNAFFTCPCKCTCTSQLITDNDDSLQAVSGERRNSSPPPARLILNLINTYLSAATSGGGCERRCLSL